MSKHSAQVVSRASPFTREAGSSQLASCVCVADSAVGKQYLEGVTSNSMLLVVYHDVFLRYSGWTIRRRPYNAITDACNAVSMHAQHKVVRIH